MRTTTQACVIFPMRRWSARGRRGATSAELRGLAAVAAAFIPALLPADIATRLTFVEHFPERPLSAVLAPFTQAWDLSGTGEVLAVPLPGHARGHLGAFVATDSGWVLLASDAAASKQSIADPQTNGPPALSAVVHHNRSVHRATLDRLARLHAGGQVAIRLTHEEGPDSGVYPSGAV